jgi:hypothetical protein
MRVWHLQHALGQYQSPVALSLHSIQLERWKEKTLCHRIGDHYLSPELRFCYQALEDRVKQTEAWELAFVTVNFSDTMTLGLAREAKRTPAGAYADIVNKRLRKAGIRCQWFTVVEDQKGNLHSHSLIGYHKDDEQAIRSCFRQDTDNLTSGMRFQKTYKLRSKMNTKRTVKNQGFTHRDGLGDFRMAFVNIGAADYISKTLEKKSPYMDSGSCRIYVPNQLRTSAKNRYEAARIKQQRLSSSKRDLSNLSCHQAITYLNCGWMPQISSEDDRLHDQQASEIDEMLGWNDFRNNSPAYDWQYEEGETAFDAYREVERFMTTKTSERDYEQAVTAAEAAYEQCLKPSEPSERDYDEILAEVALADRQQRKAQTMSERNYDQLLVEVASFLDHQLLSEEASSVEPHDELDAFIRQEGLSELVELITEHRDTFSADRPYTPSLEASEAPSDAVMTSVVTAADSARTVEYLDEALGDIGDIGGHASSPLTLDSTLQNARRRPCERFGSRGTARQYSVDRTPLGRSLARFRASPEQVDTPRDHRCLGLPQKLSQQSLPEGKLKCWFLTFRRNPVCRIQHSVSHDQSPSFGHPRIDGELAQVTMPFETPALRVAGRTREYTGGHCLAFYLYSQQSSVDQSQEPDHDHDASIWSCHAHLFSAHQKRVSTISHPPPNWK